MIFGYLYEKGIIKNGDRWFNVWCWLSFRRWYQILLIPYHIFMGIRYGYTLKRIFYFCLGCITNKIYKQIYETDYCRLRKDFIGTYSNTIFVDIASEKLAEVINSMRNIEKNIFEPIRKITND